MKRSFIQLLFFVFIIVRIVALSSCANMIPPSGGLKDTLPPRLVMALPKDSSINVNPKNITLTFDEFVTLQSPNENLIISPTMKSTPLLDYKLKNITIKLKDSFELNTTYSFNFGEAIKDVNEGNIARGLTYVFSTGKTIDYNTYSGKVFLAETGKIDTTLLVVLHNNLSDTAIKKIRPRYYTRINGKGEFTFRNLPVGKFSVYVIEGQNNFLKRYEDSTRIFAFRNDPVTIGPNTAPDSLYAFQEFKLKEKPNTTTSSQSRPTPANKDDKRLKYTIGLENGQQDLLSDFTLNFNRKLTVFDSTGFILYDSGFHKLTGYSLRLDTGKTKVILTYKWKENNYFRLLVAKNAVADSAGVTLTKSDSIRFVTKQESDYGSIRIRFPNLVLSKNPVLQVVEGDKIVESVPLTKPEFARKLYRPGTYDLRILYDSNKNGIWDTGHFGTRQQPEIVQRIPRQLTIRSNWDNEVTISL